MDGLEVLNTSDFSKNAGQFTFEVCNLTPTSVMNVEVRGEPGLYLDVWIEGKLKLTDCDGNIYTTVEIGNQVWMKENLKTTKFNDCISIPFIKENREWNNLNSPSYSFYNFDESSYKEKYGALYNYYTIQTNKLCPLGWHVPSKSEFEEMITYLGGNEIAYPKLLEGGSSGFNLTFGSLHDYPGNFGQIDLEAIFWLSGERWYVAFNSNTQNMDWMYPLSAVSSNRAFSVRCIKDN